MSNNSSNRIGKRIRSLNGKRSSNRKGGREKLEGGCDC